ncbi:hypothetical protein M422DRAFT_57632 [Sphaerobolus stellatus SS14]|nr:hypothetical protein M422DRAFT_57632 [Sphaerobolus stellatus SS14]
MPHQPIQTALIGAGIFATEDLASLVAIYSRSFKSASILAQTAKELLNFTSDLPIYHDEGALLSRKDIEAVIIALPITVQPDVVRLCLKYGKHALSEKPIAPSMEEGRKLVEEYEQMYQDRLVWRVAESEEAESAYGLMRKLIMDGRIGSAVSKMTQDDKFYKTPWRSIPEACKYLNYQGGLLHSAAVLRTALPSHPVSVSGYASLTQDFLSPADILTVAVQCSDGSHGIFELSQGTPMDSRGSSTFKVTGHDGWANVSDAEDGYRVCLHTRRSDGTEEMHWIIKADVLEKEIEWFLHPKGAVRDVAFIEAGLNSHGEKIELVL